LFAKGKMDKKDTDNFKSKWLEQHTLTEQEVKKLIAEKIERAKLYHLAEKKRKALFAESR
jgi:hypothetical protein